MKSLLIITLSLLSLNIFASDINLCKAPKSPMDYDLEQTYSYDQFADSGYYKVLFDTDHTPYKWSKNIEGTIRIFLLSSGEATVQYVERKYRTVRSKWGDEYREVVWTKRKLSFDTTWSFDNYTQKIVVEGVGEGTSAICSSENPGLNFKYSRDIGPVKLRNAGARFLYLGGANYDVLGNSRK